MLNGPRSLVLQDEKIPSIHCTAMWMDILDTPGLYA